MKLERRRISLKRVSVKVSCTVCRIPLRPYRDWEGWWKTLRIRHYLLKQRIEQKQRDADRQLNKRHFSRERIASFYFFTKSRLYGADTLIIMKRRNKKKRRWWPRLWNVNYYSTHAHKRTNTLRVRSWPDRKGSGSPAFKFNDTARRNHKSGASPAAAHYSTQRKKIKKEFFPKYPGSFGIFWIAGAAGVVIGRRQGRKVRGDVADLTDASVDLHLSGGDAAQLHALFLEWSTFEITGGLRPNCEPSHRDNSLQL